MSKPVTPKPVIVTTICSMCGLDWDEHGDNPSTEDCIRLLKIEVARKSQPCTHYHYGYQWHYTPNILTYPSTIWPGGIYQGNTSAAVPQMQNLCVTSTTIDVTSSASNTPIISDSLPQAS